MMHRGAVAFASSVYSAASCTVTTAFSRVRHTSALNRYSRTALVSSRYSSSSTRKSGVRHAYNMFLPATLFGHALGSIGYNLALSGCVCVGANVAGFLVAVVTKTHKITDLVGCGTFGVSALMTYVASAPAGALLSPARPLFLTIATTFWSVRLGGFLFYRILQTGTDKRLDGFYNKEGEPWLSGPSKFPLALGAFWMIQAAWEWFTLLPVTVSQAFNPTQPMGPWGWTGFGLFMFFWAYEAIADYQKDAFKRQPGNRNEFMRTGLYKYSQFPNYFAEVSCWWVMFTWAGFPSVFMSNKYIVLSPLMTTYIVIFLSGYAMLAKSQMERYGERADYQEYIASTPPLVPFLPVFKKPQVQQPLLRDAGNEDDEDAA